jgi:hypothetical protein
MVVAMVDSLPRLILLAAVAVQVVLAVMQHQVLKQVQAEQAQILIQLGLLQQTQA